MVGGGGGVSPGTDVGVVVVVGVEAASSSTSAKSSSQTVLRLRLPDARAPELVGDEQQDQHAGRDAGAPDRTQDPRQPHRGTLPAALAALVASEGRP